MKDLLICIAFHYSEERLKYLYEVLKNITLYNCGVEIIIDTNTFNIEHLNRIPNITVFVHQKLEHPFHLTWIHRQHIKNNIDNYNVFMYIEDDEVVPYLNYLNYIENFKLLWPNNVPSFVRIEVKDMVEYVSDIPKQIEPHDGLYWIHSGTNKIFAIIPFPINYHGFWIMPQKELKESMKENFVRLSDGREFAAMYVGWELGKATLLQIENGVISKKCYSYHLPNNYALSEGTPNGKIKPENIFL